MYASSGGGGPNVFHETVGYVFSHVLVQCCLVSGLTSTKPAGWLLPPHKVIAIISDLLILHNVLSYKQTLQVFGKSTINI